MKVSHLKDGNTQSLVVPVLAELISRGDGTFMLRPRVPTGELDTWISIREAAKILGLKPRSLYRLLGRYLVYRRALPTRIVVSLKSVLAFKQATLDPEFWDNRALQQKFEENTARSMDGLARQALPQESAY